MKTVSLLRQSNLSNCDHHHQLGCWVLRAWFNSWSIAIRNASSSSPVKALKLYSQMHRKSLQFDSFSILYAINSCTHLHDNINSLSIIRHPPCPPSQTWLQYPRLRCYFTLARLRFSSF
ncbi:PPR domain-containing protein [Forsythia ovata]|uniref:PPR domain-containing protein n=1 Tax=Forsythia ovata TaxID=205694 RepID=A0ABD1QCQ4_9LAMI